MSEKSLTLQIGISWILRVGVLLSVALESAGLILNYVQTGTSNLDLTAGNSWNIGGGNFFAFVSSTLHSLSQGLSSLTLVSLGIATLMLTPYLRVIAAVVYYSIEKDWKYVMITTIVFLVITAGLIVF